MKKHLFLIALSFIVLGVASADTLAQNTLFKPSITKQGLPRGDAWRGVIAEVYNKRPQSGGAAGYVCDPKAKRCYCDTTISGDCSSMRENACKEPNDPLSPVIFCPKLTPSTCVCVMRDGAAAPGGISGGTGSPLQTQGAY